MANEAAPRAGELTTANYGWTKPTVGASVDAWGGYLNADLDGIDSTVKSVSNAIPIASSTTPLMDGTAAVGTGTTWARADHAHPTDTSRYAASNPSGYQTAANVTASLASYLALSGGTMTGAITLAADPAANLQPATKQYCDGVRYGDNRIINGNFAINQRVQVSGTALAAAAYGHDRWKAGASGCTYTFTQGAVDTTITITAGTLTQVIEAGMIEGGVYTLSWTGTAQARVYQGAPTGSYAASPLVTASLPAGVNTIVEFNTGTVVKVKFEIGSIATPFNRQSLAKSMADCQRYCYIRSASIEGALGYIALGQAYAAGSLAGWILFPVTMRAAPTISCVISNLGCSTAAFGTNGLSGGNFTPVPSGTQFGLTGAANLVAGNASMLLWSGTSGVFMASAEL